MFKPLQSDQGKLFSFFFFMKAFRMRKNKLQCELKKATFPKVSDRDRIIYEKSRVFILNTTLRQNEGKFQTVCRTWLGKRSKNIDGARPCKRSDRWISVVVRSGRDHTGKFKRQSAGPLGSPAAEVMAHCYSETTLPVKLLFSICSVSVII